MPVRAQSGGHLAAPLAIAVCGIAVFALVVAGIAMTRRGRSPSSDSVTEIDRSTPRVGQAGASGTRPLPVNGYENPTYQYYQAAEAEAAAGDAGKDAEQ